MSWIPPSVVSWYRVCGFVLRQPIARKKAPQYQIGFCWKWTVASRKKNHHLSTWRLICVPSTMGECMRYNRIVILCILTFATSYREQEDNPTLMLRSTHEMLLTLGIKLPFSLCNLFGIKWTIRAILRCNLELQDVNFNIWQLAENRLL